MTIKVLPFPRWTTASIPDAAESAPMELEHLGSHYSACNVQRGRWFRVQRAAESLHDFFAPRLVTTLCLAAAGIAILVAVV